MEREIKLFTLCIPTHIAWAACVSVCLGAALLCGCVSSNAALPLDAAVTPEQLHRTQWRDTEDVPAGAQPLTLLFDDSLRVSGFAGCNRIMGASQVAIGQLRVGPLATTRMLCDAASNAREAQYMQALEAAREARFQSGQLVLRNAQGEVVRRFAPLP